MRKTILLLAGFAIGFSLSFSPVQAGWLRNVPQELVQPDGSVLNCFASGDEYYNWLHDGKGFTILKHPETGYYVYARKVGRDVGPTALIPGKDDPAAAGLLPGIGPDPELVTQIRKSRQAVPELKGGFKSASVGTLNNIFIFIRFSDQTEYPEAGAFYESAFNATGAVSVKDYFREVSSSQLTVNTTFYPTLSGSTIVSYQDIQPRNYYRAYNVVTNPIGYQNDNESRDREHNLLKRAVDYVRTAVEATGLDYDYNNDGQVDNVIFCVKGSAEGWSSLLWPHQWSLYTLDVRIGTLRVYRYNFLLSDGFQVGTTCHELSHTLGAPDLYHYTDNGIAPVGRWDLMEYNMDPPQHMGAYVKYKYFGWYSAIEQITNAGTYSLSPLSSNPFACYKIASPNSANEFFLVEYRKREGRYESSIPGSGLIVYRINPTITGNSDGPPDEVYAYRPGGTLTQNGDVGSANYSLETGRTAINSSTSPSPFLSNGSAGGLSITNIGSASSSISFTVGFPAAGPDLVITDPQVVPTSVNAGAQISVSCKLTNQGTVSAGASTLRIYLSSNNTYEPGDVPIAYGNMASVSAGGTLNVSGQNITIPSGTASGNYFVVFVADADAAVNESDESNNQNYSSLAVTGTNVFNPPRNLAAGVTGTSVTLTWDAPLTGSSGTLSGYKIYRGGNLIYTSLAPLVRNYTDASLSPGTYTYHVTATYTAASGESAASNTASATVSSSGLPDLIITQQSINPATVQAGGTIDLSCRLTNQGTALAGTSTLRIYLSANITWDVTDVLLAYGDMSAVSAGSYLPVSGTGITVPAGTVAGNYYVLYQADATGTVQESNENNNISYNSLTVTGTQVYNPPRSLTAGVSGTSVTLNWTAPLAGSSGTLSGYKVYRNGSLINTLANPAALTYTNSGLSAGTYTFYLTATYVNSAGESGASNEVTVTVTVVTLPDLTISNPAVTPASVLAGNDVTLTCQLVNQGNAQAASSLLRVYLSINAAVDGTDVLLASGTMNAVNAGSSLEVSGEGIGIPANVTPGNYYVLFVADATSLVNESNENNNIGSTQLVVADPNVFNPPRNLAASVSGNQVTLTWGAPAAGSTGTLSTYRIYRDGTAVANVAAGQLTYTDQNLEIRTYSYQVTAVFVNPAGESDPSNSVSVIVTSLSLPDLTITVPSVTPGSVYPGNTIDLSCRLVNLGNRLAGVSVLRVFLSSNLALDASDVQLAYGSMDEIDPGTYLTITGDDIPIPQATVPGTYFVLFIADADATLTESNEANNTGYAILTVNSNYVFNPPTNLSASVNGNEVTLSWNRPAQGYSGTHTGYKILQNGTVAATIINPSDQQYTMTGLAIGNYTFALVATYASPDGESASSNTVSVSVTAINRPDLVITNQSVTPVTINRGEPVSLVCRLENRGTATAGPTVIRVYLSTDQTHNSGDVALAFGNMESVNPGHSISISGDGITIPRLTAPGNYYILFVADADAAVTESNEANNVAWSGITVTIGTGIEKSSWLDDLSVYPVPAGDNLNLKYEGPVTGQCRITILGVAGNVLSQATYWISNGALITWDTRSWVNGVYFIRLESELQTSIKQVIINH